MPDPTADLIARQAAMAREQANRQRMVREVTYGGQQEEPVRAAPTLDQGGFDIFDPRKGTEKIAYVEKGKAAMVAPDGNHVWVPTAEAQTYADNGYQVESLTEYHARKEQESIEASTGDAALGGFVSGVSGGLSDVLMREYYGTAAAKREGRIREASPVAAGVAELLGFGAGMVAAAPEAVAGAASKAGRKFAGQVARLRMTPARARAMQKAMLEDNAGLLAGIGKKRLAEISKGAFAPGKWAKPGAKVATKGGAATKAQKQVQAALRRPGGRFEKRLFREMADAPVTSVETMAARRGLTPARFAKTEGGRLGRRIAGAARPKGKPDLGFAREPGGLKKPAPPYERGGYGRAFLERTMQPRATVGGRDVGNRAQVQEMIDALDAPASVAPEAIQQRLARTIARGAVEGGLYAGSREMSEQALSGRDYNAAQIVEQAIQGAAWGSAVSMHGAGLGRVMGQVSKRLASGTRRALAKPAKVDVGRFETLLDRQAGLVERLKFTTHPVQRANLQGMLKDVRKAILADRIKLFSVAGRGLKSLRLPLAIAPLTYGFTLSNLMLGAATQAVPYILKTRLAMRAMTGAGRAARGAERFARPFGAPVTRLAIVGGLTSNDAEQLAASLEATDAEEVSLAALQGYKLAGMDEGMASYMAEFQKRRVELLQQVIMRRPGSTTGIVAGRILNAVEDPRRIATRLAEGEILTEDLVALQYLFPEVYEELQKQSKLLLEKPGLSARQRVDLMKLAGTHGQLTQAMQATMQRPQQKAQSQPKAFKPSKDVATESQRLQGGTS
jgi:hypothetical protein